MLDLNLLRVFDALLEERSVTRAGARLGLTQSAVSHALNRLRYAIGDELFVRGPTGMQPTARAADMGPQVHAALVQLQAITAPADFDPATSERRFTIVAGAFPSGVLTPPLVARMAAEAPLAELAIAPYTVDMLDLLDSHRVDFLVSGLMAIPDRFAMETIVRERLTWVVRVDHPLAQRNDVDLKALVSIPHVTISAGLPGQEEPLRRGFGPTSSGPDAGFEAALEAEGLTRRIGVTVPDSYSAVAVVARSDMATVIPRRLALLSAQLGRVAMIEPPYESPPVDVALVYLKARLAEPAMAWMRDLIRATSATI